MRSPGGADVLFHDVEYGDDEYPNHVGWGHSSTRHVMGFAHQGRGRHGDPLPPRSGP